MSIDRLSERSGGVIGTIGPIGGSGVFSLQERYALTADNYENVSLYLKMNGANGSTTFYDSSQYGHTVTANGNAQISTAVSKFGGASAAFDGTGDYLTVPSSAAFNFGTGDFTVELWFYAVSVANNPMIWTHVNATSGSNIGWFIELGSSGQVYFGKGVFFGDNLVTSVGVFSTTTWTHLAAVRQGSNLTLYINGTQVGTKTAADFGNNFDRTESVYIGRFFTSTSFDFNGYIDSLRITKGLAGARYTGNFTPPQREFLP